jgi:hypothetical protein
MTPNYRVRIVIYDNVNSTPENPEFKSDEPFYGEDEMSVQAYSLARQFRRKNEAEQ